MPFPAKKVEMRGMYCSVTICGFVEEDSIMDFDDERQTKRRRLGSAHGPLIEIKRVEDLQNALVFRKSSSPEVKKGTYTFHT